MLLFLWCNVTIRLLSRNKTLRDKLDHLEQTAASSSKSCFRNEDVVVFFRSLVSEVGDLFHKLLGSENGFSA